MEMKVPFLKKRQKKSVQEMKKISQPKANALFLGSLVFFIVLCGLTIFLSFSKLVSDSSEVPTVEAVSERTVETDNRLNLFLESYVVRFFNYKHAEQEEYTETLDGFYNFVPEIKSHGNKKEEMSLVSYRVEQILKDVAIYRVTYESVGKRITVLFGIPYAGKDGQYYVTGLPYFDAVTDYKAKEVDKEEALTLGALDDLSEADRDTLEQFLELFFKNYTTSQENLDIVAKNVVSINGVEFKTLDYTYFKIDEKKNVTAYVQATFEILGTTYNQNFTFEMTRKEDGSFYVEKMLRTIPSDYDE